MSDSQLAIALPPPRTFHPALRAGFAAAPGPIAWWLWGFAHIYFLIGVRNRLSVALNWLWIYARNQRRARLIAWQAGEAEGTAPFTTLPRD